MARPRPRYAAGRWRVHCIAWFRHIRSVELAFYPATHWSYQHSGVACQTGSTTADGRTPSGTVAMNQIGKNASAAPLQAAWRCIKPLPLGLASMSPRHRGPHRRHLYLFRDRRGDGPPAALSEIAPSLQATQKGRNDCNQRLATIREPHRPVLSRVRCIAVLCVGAMAYVLQLTHSA